MSSRIRPVLPVVLAVVVVTAALLLARPGPVHGSGALDGAQVQRARLSQAAAGLLGAPSLALTGSVKDSSGSSVRMTATHVLPNGQVIGSVELDGSPAQFIQTGGRLFVKTDGAYWVDGGIVAEEDATAYDRKWVEADPDLLAVDVAGELNGPALVKKLLGGKPDIAVGDTSTVDGAEVVALTANGITAYVTTAEPPKIVRLAEHGAGDFVPPPSIPPPGSGGPTSTEGAYDLAVSTDDPALFTGKVAPGLAGGTRGLDKAATARVVLTITPHGLSPCDEYACTARVGLSIDDGPANAAIPVTGTIGFTLDDRPIKTCSLRSTIRVGAQTEVACSTSYDLPADGSIHNIESHPSFTAVAMTAQQAGALSTSVSTAVSEVERTAVGPGRYGYDPRAAASPVTGLPAGLVYAVPSSYQADPVELAAYQHGVLVRATVPSGADELVGAAIADADVADGKPVVWCVDRADQVTTALAGAPQVISSGRPLYGDTVVAGASKKPLTAAERTALVKLVAVATAESDPRCKP